MIASLSCKRRGFFLEEARMKSGKLMSSSEIMTLKLMSSRANSRSNRRKSIIQSRKLINLRLKISNLGLVREATED